MQNPTNNIQTDSKESSARISITSSLAVKTLAWIGVCAVLYLGKAALAPVLFAIVLAMLLSPLVDWLELRRIPRMLAALLSVCIVIASIGLIIDVAWGPTLKWIDSAPAVLQKVEQRVRPLRRMISRLESVTNRASSLTASTTTNPASTPASGSPDAVHIDALTTTRLVLIDTTAVAILTVFLLAIGARTLRRIEAALVNHGHRYQCMRVVESVRSELSRYFATLTLINIGLGLVTSGVMALWGLPSPWLWGIMAAVLNFIPYVGPTITLFILTVVSIVTFEGYGPAIGVAGSYLLITAFEGQFIQPLLVGFRLNLNPIVLFLGIWLAGWFWGVAGVLLATPVLIALKEIANQQTELSVLKAILNGQIASGVINRQERPGPVIPASNTSGEK